MNTDLILNQFLNLSSVFYLFIIYCYVLPKKLILFIMSINKSKKDNNTRVEWEQKFFHILQRWFDHLLNNRTIIII